jgi:N-methylhydantoinase A/oxoprolinase/acetone carboxylase beta subunit
MGLLINIDNGGTLTDFCMTNGATACRTKTLTTPFDLSKCLFDGLVKLSRMAFGAEDVARLLLETDHIRYSTTQGTNSLVERKGPRLGIVLVGLDPASLCASPASRSMFEALVGSRVSVLAGDLGDAEFEGAATRAINALAASGANRIVVGAGGRDCTAQELRLQRLLLRRFPPHLLGALPVLYSHQLVEDELDARRIWTAVINAFLHPSMERFLYSTEQRLRDRNARNPLLIFRNDGGASRIARTAAIKTYSSGPRGGAEGLRALARSHGLDHLIGVDIGGTTTDLSLIEQGEVRCCERGQIDGVDVSIPLANIASTGVGGSSIMRVSGAAIVVGPDSVGSAPGPACFGLGGTSATITDAFLASGLLDPATFFGGELSIDPMRAAAVVRQNVAEPLGVTPSEALTLMERAWVHRVASAVAGFSDVSADTAIAAFGGAGPFVMCRIAERLDIGRILIPGFAAVFSAFGVGFSDIRHDFETRPSRLDTEAVEVARKELLDRARRALFGEGFALEDCSTATWLRVGDQRFELTEEMVRRLASTAEGTVWVGLSAIRSLPRIEVRSKLRGETVPAVRRGERRVAVDGSEQPLALYRLEDQPDGASGTGPAVLEETYYTCRVDSGWQFQCAASGDVLLTRAAEVPR